MGQIAHQQKLAKFLAKQRHLTITANSSTRNKQDQNDLGDKEKSNSFENPLDMKESDSINVGENRKKTHIQSQLQIQFVDKTENQSELISNMECIKVMEAELEISIVSENYSDSYNYISDSEEVSLLDSQIKIESDNEDESIAFWTQDSAIIEKIAYQQTVGGLWVPHLVLREEQGNTLWIPVLNQLMMWISPQRYCARCGHVEIHEDALVKDESYLGLNPPPKIALCKECQKEIEANLQEDCKSKILEQIEQFIIKTPLKNRNNTDEFSISSIDASSDISQITFINEPIISPSQCLMCNMVEKCFGTYTIIFRLGEIQSFSSEKKATPDPLSYYASGWIALIPQDKIWMELQLRGSQAMVLLMPEKCQRSKMDGFLGIIKVWREKGIIPLKF